LPFTGAHVPGVSSHASHWPVHGEPQHTPSAQKPEAQTVPVVHGDPLPRFATHMPALQCAVVAQSASTLQDVAQLMVSAQPYAPHACVPD
jgi:hypothetical protein